MTILKTARWIALIIGIAGLFIGKVAEARPEYARKEGVACQYCHDSGSPNSIDTATGRREPTTRNERGIYYGSHNHSFAGYVEKPAGNNKAIPSFHLAWQGAFLDAPRRMAVADVVGDGTPRLITLNEQKDNKNAGILIVRKWNGKTFLTEFTEKFASTPDSLAVGKFAGKDRPAVIVTGDSLWFWNGMKFERKPAAHPLSLFGVTRLKDGVERVLIAETPTDIKAYRVDTGATGDWLIDKIPAPFSHQVLWGDMHATPEVLGQMGINDEFNSGGLVGIWDLWKTGTIYIYHADRDYDLVADPNNKNKPKAVYNNKTSTVTFSIRAVYGGNLWTSPKLSGVVYDIVTDDPKGSGIPGFAVLSSADDATRGRSVYFFTLDQAQAKGK